MDKRNIALLAGLVLVIVGAFWMVGDTQQLVVSDLQANEAEMTTLAQSLLFGEKDEDLYEKYSSTYDIACYAEDGMVQYTVAGSAYSGVYYSAEDVPLAYQGADAELIEADGGWNWSAEGDNSGYTEKISEGWYYFEVKG